jgi:hypothetical protein
MSSQATATFNFSNLKLGSLPPADTDVGIITVLKKKVGDSTLSFTFSDASLKDPKAGQGILLGAEATLKGNYLPLMFHIFPKSLFKSFPLL